jgi:uncharacterized membrane protein
MTDYINKHGRRPGRGIRPWLLIPKILSVGALFGGFLAASALLHASAPQTHEQWAHVIATTSTLFLRLIVPAVFCVILFGVLLFFQHPKQFMKMRWFQVKVVLLIVALPPLHLTGRWLIHHAREALEVGDLVRVAELMGRFLLTADLAVLAVIVVIVIGRHKPRFGQRPKTLAQQHQAASEKD